ncbi:MAG TPA: hypothetical protein VKE24_09780 [Candidatus Acidoferrales bacterium]|nr:hypothetical protein [Candidatus Acidoferrales bacterium]
MCRAVAVAGVVLAALTALRVAAQDLHVGWIEKIDCPAEWRANVRAQPKKLPKAGPRRFLYPGEGVRCVGPGKMLVQDHAELVSLAERGKWHNLRREGIGASKADEEAVERFGRVAGRSRGLGGPIFSPVNEGVVRLAGLVVRWTPTVTPGPIRLRLIDDEGNELWRVEGIQGSAGLFRSESLRRVLGQQRDAKYAGQFTLSLAQGGSAEPPVTFSLLSAGEEKALEEDLARCASKQGLMHNACRAYVFETRRMWNDVAAEYDDALASDTASPDLIAAAIRIHRLIGDTDTAERLTAQLPPGSKTPE